MPVTSKIVDFDCVVGTDSNVQDTDPFWISKINGNNPKMLSIPGYQRPFDWKIHHFDSLIEDIVEAIDEEKSTYYLGPVGMHDLGNGQLDIVDGQQRFTAITLLAIAIRDICIDKGFFRVASNIHQKLIFLDTMPRLESGEDPDVPKLDQNRTQLAFLQHWPSGDASYRFEPPPISNMTLIFTDSSPLPNGDDRKVKLKIDDWMKYPIGQSNVPWKFGNSKLIIAGPVNFDTMANGEFHTITNNQPYIEFEAYVINQGPDDINPGDSSEPNPILFDTDHDYFLREGFAESPDKRASMFGTYRQIRQRLLQLMEEKCDDRDEELAWSRNFFALICKFETTITLFGDLYEALNYFEKINDGSFSEPLNVRDLFNYRVKMLDHHYSRFVDKGYDKSNTSPNTIKEYLEDISGYWSGIRDVLQPIQVKKNKGGAHLIADFFQMYLLAKGNRKTSAKVQKELEENDLAISPNNNISISAKPSEVLSVLADKRGRMAYLEHFAKCYASIMIHNTQSDRYLRMKHIQQNFTQGRSLLLSAIAEIRRIAGFGIKFDDDKDYSTKNKDCYDLEIKIIEMVEYHVARSIILRHETDIGFGGGDWFAAVEDWNKAIYYAEPAPSSAADLKSILDKIWLGGGVTIKDGSGKVSTFIVKGIKTENDSRAPNFISGGVIHSSIQNNRYNIKQGTFLVWILEQKFRKCYPSAKAGLDNLDIKEEQTLEHILPQSCWKSKNLPVSGWEWWDPSGANVTDKNDVRDYVDRLGNMCIVKQKYNSSYGNNPFIQKQTNKTGEYKSFTKLSSSWLTMSDLSAKVKSATITALDCFDPGAFGPPSHHASLPFTKWEKVEIDARNKWMFECLQTIFS